MSRFVILEHDHPQHHYDLMLESGDVLWTWRLPHLPRIGDVLDAERVFDHRLVYLEYEGPISGNRGTVLRREHGAMMWQRKEDGHLEVRMNGVQLHALLRLTREDDGTRWRIECVA